MYIVGWWMLVVSILHFLRPPFLIFFGSQLYSSGIETTGAWNYQVTLSFNQCSYSLYPDII